MERVRTYLNPIRAEQLRLIADHAGFESIALYLDNHISKEWEKLSGKDAPLLPGFEIYSATENDRHIVFFAATGTTAIHMTAFEASQFGAGINLVLNDEQRTFFIASTIDTAFLSFGKQGTGYQFIVNWKGGNKKFAISESIAKDLSEIFIYHSTN